MEKRFKILEQQLKEIQSELKSRGLTLDEVSDEIGCSFRNCLYKGTSLSSESFKSLKSLYGSSIQHEIKFLIDGSGHHEKIRLERCRELAELVGVMLGDGCISRYKKQTESRFISNYYVSVTLHQKEDKIREKCVNLLQEVVGKTPAIEEPENQNIVHLKLYGKKFVEIFESIGLEAGDKVENQVSVPNWIKQEKKFERACLRGLIDTDGSVYQRGEDGYVVVKFKNRSQPLLKDFEKMCRDLEIRTSKAGEYDRQIASQTEVKKFIQKVNPIKAEKFEI
jgi:intein/homing endonuclease